MITGLFEIQICMQALHFSLHTGTQLLCRLYIQMYVLPTNVQHVVILHMYTFKTTKLIQPGTYGAMHFSSTTNTIFHKSLGSNFCFSLMYLLSREKKMYHAGCWTLIGQTSFLVHSKKSKQKWIKLTFCNTPIYISTIIAVNLFF